MLILTAEFVVEVGWCNVPIVFGLHRDPVEAGEGKTLS